MFKNGLKIITTKGFSINAEANLNLNLNFPFVYHANGGSELPNENCFDNKGSFFDFKADFSGLNKKPIFIYRQKFIPKVSAKWPDLGKYSLKKYTIVL